MRKFIYSFVVLFFTNILKADITNGLLAYYPFDGNSTNDISGNGYDGTNYGATFVEGKFGNGVDFNGVIL